MGNMDDARVAIANSSMESAVLIGCDSKRFRKKVNGKWLRFAKYCTVVVLHVDSNKGCKLFYKMDVMEDYGSVKQRMLNEVMFAVSVALEFQDVVGERPFAFHIDINPNKNFESNKAMAEARGWVLGNLGIEPEFKPNSPAASFAADYLLKVG